MAIISPAPAIAGSETGFIKDISVRDSDGLIVVSLFASNWPPINHPACAFQPYWIIPDEKSDSGKRLHSLLLAAQLSGRNVSIRGKDTCLRWPDGEDIDSVTLSGQ